MSTTRNKVMERWAQHPEEQRAWVTERLAAVDPYRTNAWTDVLDDAIAVLDEAGRAAAEPEAKCSCTITRHERQENRACPVHFPVSP